MGLQRLIEVCRKIVKRNPGEVLVDLGRNARLCCLSQEASQLAEGLRRGDQHQTIEGVVLGASIQDFRHLLREEVFFERMPVGARRHRMAASVTDAFLGPAGLSEPNSRVGRRLLMFAASRTGSSVAPGPA